MILWTDYDDILKYFELTDKIFLGWDRFINRYKGYTISGLPKPEMESKIYPNINDKYLDKKTNDISPSFNINDDNGYKTLANHFKCVDKIFMSRVLNMKNDNKQNISNNIKLQDTSIGENLTYSFSKEGLEKESQVFNVPSKDDDDQYENILDIHLPKIADDLINNNIFINSKGIIIDKYRNDTKKKISHDQLSKLSNKEFGMDEFTRLELYKQGKKLKLYS
jgi:hypothetical protein